MNSSKKVIGIDLDDVLLDFNPAFIDWHNAFYNTSFHRNDVTIDSLEKKLGHKIEEINKKIINFYNTDFHFNALPVEGGVEAIRQLSENNSLIIITAKPDRYKEHTLRWIDTHFSDNCFDDICFTNQFYGDGIKKTKSEVCKNFGVNIFIDDHVKNVKEVAEAGIKSFLFDSPWNQEEINHDNITRVYSWNDILKRVDMENNLHLKET